MKIYTVYKVTNLINEKYYIGVHATSNIEDDYLGSGKILKQAILKYGKENFKKEILAIFENKQNAFDLEKELVNEEIIKTQNCYNICLGGGNPPINRWSKGKKLQYVSDYKTQYWIEWRKNNPNYKEKWRKYTKIGISISSREKYKESTIKRNSTIIQCPYCYKKGNLPNMKRWHFENCKELKCQ